ncbi:nucleotide-binding protein [Candidatus Sulfidibacterium hydrothermale]|uniref:nucleotide-binding protein n=1 Tax=Candidatus Sulfidibacterium hydrothermale TaxID=2875962 RepID=UPI001F0B1EAA|nr:nucleotide-binding protein [Candidatus Sulfidibacterium hydrothermale]UBM61308.1 nucleotide-binding protein [Candidatus Sulfidibacterium hydrothermale]
MPIQRINRVIKQQIVDDKKITAENFIKLLDELSALSVFQNATVINVTLQYDNLNVTGNLQQVRSDLNQIDKSSSLISMSCSFQVNLNPRKTLSISINHSNNIFNLNGNNFNEAETKEIYKIADKHFPKKKEAEVITSTKDTNTTNFLPGPFAPVQLTDAPSDKKVFIIMSFQDQHRDAYFVAIEPTLRKLGFEPIRVDQIQHNNTVTSEILKELESAAFVVADLTGERPNVYYEIGWAHRANKEVVLTARKDTAIHFDVAAINRIEYTDYTDLCSSLSKRVKAIAKRLGLDVKE